MLLKDPEWASDAIKPQVALRVLWRQETLMQGGHEQGQARPFQGVARAMAGEGM